MNLLLVFLILISFDISAQIADSSFFSSVKSLNPGVAHLRDQGFVSADYAITKVEKHHAVDVPSIQGGVNTDMEMNKLSIFRAGKGPGITIEALYDQERAVKNERIKSASLGDRNIETTAQADYLGAAVDLTFIGIQFAQSNYEYDYKFRVGDPPDVSARDLLWKRDYKLIKLGSAFKYRSISIGIFGFNLKSDGNLSYTFYDPTTGDPGTTEHYGFNSEVKGMGAGVGFKNKKLHFEFSYERANKQDLSKDASFPVELDAQKSATRLSLVGEIQLSFISLGLRFRSISGNFTDLEDIVKANLLYAEMSDSDKRTETTFNFGFGKGYGFGLSAFYSVSEVETNETSDIFATGFSYPATTKTTAYGVNINYTY